MDEVVKENCDILNKAADAQLLLNKGDYYYFGRGCFVGYVKVAQYYKQLANSGNCVAQNKLGDCYYNKMVADNGSDVEKKNLESC